MHAKYVLLVFSEMQLMCFCLFRGTGIRGLMRGIATLPQGNQELLVVKDKVRRPPGEFEVSKSMECDIFPYRPDALPVAQPTVSKH